MASFSIENVRVFDGESLGEPRTVSVVDGRLADSAPEGSEVIDGSGATLLPGLIDAHVHVDAPDQLVTLAQWGVTTALDMAAKNAAVLSSLRGMPGGTDIRSAGFPAGPPDATHIARMGYPAGIGIAKPEDASAWVEARVAEGSDYIKVLLEPAIPFQPKPLSPHTAAAIVRAAHERGLLVIAHTTTDKTAEIAAEAGVDAITHIPLGGVLDERFARRLRDASIVVIPTLSMMKAIAADWPFPVRPPGVKFDNAVASVGVLARAGVTIVAGTDANADPSTPARPPFGESLHAELALMVDAGLTPAQALTSATANAAEFFGLTDRGSIETGLRADLVLIDGDPTADITATRALRGVWIAGERVR